MTPRLRMPAAVVALLLVVGLAVAAPSKAVPRDPRPNVVVILSDDQPFESIPHDPAAMPRFQRLLDDPRHPWIRFPNAFVNTPLCCPSRASILTGRYSNHTGVPDNESGERFDDTRTIATALDAAGYTTALVGKYLNGYPFGHSPVAPPGWDRWFAKLQGPQTSVYYHYAVTDDGFTIPHGAEPEDYSTDVYARAAAEFIRTAPERRPFFLMFTPMAPHSPWTPAPRDVGSWTAPLPMPPSFDERDVSDKPSWVRSLPAFDRRERSRLREVRRRAYETLGALDDAVMRILGALQKRRLLANTIVVFLTDNGFSFGEHRWVTKSCPYDECIRTPFFVRYPGIRGRTDLHPVSNVDLAPTIAALARTKLQRPADGRSLVPLLVGRHPSRWRVGVLAEFEGGRDIPAWWEMRTQRYAYIEYETGERELYDMAGALGPADRYQRRNVIGTPRYAEVERSLAEELRVARRR